MPVLRSQISNLSQTSSKSQSRNSVSSLAPSELDQYSAEQRIPGFHDTIINTGISSFMFQDYSHIANDRPLHSEIPSRLGTTQTFNTGIYGALNALKTQTNHTSERYNFSYGTLASSRHDHDHPRLTSTSRLENGYELQTEAFERNHTTPTCILQQNNLNANTSSLSPLSLFVLTKLWRRYRKAIQEFFHRNQVEDLERQPLLPPLLRNPDRGETSNNENYDNRSEHVVPPTIFGINRQTLLIIVGVLAGNAVVIVVLLTGNQEILINMLKAIICNLCGANLSRFLGNVCSSS